METREHLFKVCPEWKAQQTILWTEVQKETGKWKSRWKVRDLLANERCSRTVLGFLSATTVGKLVPPGDDAGSEVSEWELRERREREEERRAEAEELGAAGDWAPWRNNRCSYPCPPSWHPPKMRRDRGTGTPFSCSLAGPESFPL